MNLTRTHWTQADYDALYAYLTALADAKYKKFTDSLVPGGGASLGVRVPALRAAAKAIAKGNYAEFLKCEMGDTREEILICGFVMSYIKCADYPTLISYVKRYAGMITSWETCDLAAFNEIKRYRAEFFADIEYFIYNADPWAARYGFGCLMRYYLTDDYIDRVFEYVGSVDSDFYYLQMMQAWLVAAAAAKCRDKTMAFLAENRLNAVTQNMAVRKIRESNRISKEDKEYVKRFAKTR